MLKINNLKVERDNKEILQDLSLKVGAGEIHVIMGPNGSGKSTLATTLAGHPDCNVVSGKIEYKEKNLLDLNPTERAQAGIFLSYQQPISIPGLSQFEFLRTIHNIAKKAHNENSVSPEEFLPIARKYISKLGLNDNFLTRSLNENFSGGEQKRNELLQMFLVEPSLIIFDELDSGLDSAGQALIKKTISEYLTPKKTFIVITHNGSLYENLPITKAHIMQAGKIVRSGDKNLLSEIDQYGYSRIN